MPSFRSALLVVTALAALSFTPACSSSGDDAAVTGDDANLTQLSAGDVKVEGKPVELGTSHKYSATIKDKVRIHAVPFAGTAGEAITAESHSTWGGTLYVLKQVGTHYAVLSSTKADPKKAADITITLKTGGDFFIGFEVTAPKSAAKSASATVTLKLGGVAKVADASFIGKLKSTYESDSNDSFDQINESDLPAAALKDWKDLNKTWGPDYAPVAYTWTLEGKKLFVVENDNDGGMSISFYDSTGKWIAGGSAGESTEFTWS